MKTKSLIFALGICLFLLSGCVASVGTGYGYYPPVRPYYYAPRPPRPYYRPHYDGGYRPGGGFGGGYRPGGGGRHGRY